MKTLHPRAAAAALLAVAVIASPAVAARFYDSFSSPDTNWTLVNNSGTASIGSSVLTLSSPASTISTPTATLNTAQALTGTRQSILARSHVGVANKTVFFLWATDTATGNKLELKINDQSSTTMTAGYYTGGGGTYNFAGSVAYAPGSEGLYMAFREASGTTYWEVSTDAVNWTVVASLTSPVSTNSMTFAVQHKCYATTTSATSTVVDCFNYRATGTGYHRIEDKTYNGTTSTPDGWHLYVEAFCNACNYVNCNGIEPHYACQASDGGSTTCNNMGTGFDCSKAKFNCVSPTLRMTVNCVDSSQHATDGSWIKLQMSTDRLTDPGSAGWYMNMYRYQNLAFVDADVWTYHLYFKFDHLDTVLQGIEFPINKYLSNGNRLQGAVAWYPNRPEHLNADGTYTGVLKVWSGTAWDDGSGFQSVQTADLRPSTPTDTTHAFYELSFTVGLHDSHVYYTDFKLGYAGAMTTYPWSHTYNVNTNTSSTTARIAPAFQLDNNTSDGSNTTKNVWVEGWDIDWADEKLP